MLAMRPATLHQSGRSDPSHTRLGWLSASLLIAAPAAFVVWIVWVVITIQGCPVLDIRMVAGPTVALLLSSTSTGAAVVMLMRRSTALGVALLTVGLLECIAFGLEVLQAAFCIPAAP
jgi:hypothetical protein